MYGFGCCWLGPLLLSPCLDCLFWALREFITLTLTRKGDHRAAVLGVFPFTPLHYVLVGLNRYDIYSVFLPVYATLFVLARAAVAGDYKRFLERTAKIQAGLVVCVYCLSFAPALLELQVDGVPERAVELGSRDANFRLLFFLILLVQFADCMQYVWSRMLGQRLVAAAVSSNRTWEGLLGSATSTALLAAVLWWAAPPFQPWQAAIVGLVVAVMGFAGGMTMSAIKRDRGVKDYGTLVVGHGGVLDRIDSICFAAPVFYHMTVSVIA